MKKTKRFISMLLSLAMILAMVAVPVYATGNATVTVGSYAGEANPGDNSVELPVTITNNPGFTNYEWNIEYDTTRLTLDRITSDMDVIANPDKDGKGYVTYARATAVEGDKTLFTLHFTVKDNAPTGTAEVKIESDNFNDGSSDPDVAVEATYVAGTVNVAGTGSPTTGTGETTPGTGETTPGTGETTPGTGETTPGTGETTPGTGETTPGTGETTPGTGETDPGTDEETGTVTDATPDDNLGGAALETPLDQLMNAIPFTDEEKAQIDGGADVVLSLLVEDISATVSADEKALIESALNGQTVGMYMDVRLMKQVGTGDFSLVSNLNNHVTIAMAMPENLLSTDEAMTRTYSVLRIHDGKVDAVNTEFNAETGMLSFETDRFSTYAVVYKDAPVGADDSDSPKTGDVSDVMTWVALLLVSGGMLTAATYKMKKKAK